MYRTILVPTDGSPGADRAVEEALGLAKEWGATVHALYVVEGLYSYDFDRERMLSMLEEEGEAVTADVADRARARDVTVHTAVRRGHPEETILEYADEVDADCIVTGTHGRRGLSRVVLGSVTERVVRRSPVPVLTVRAPADDEARAAGAGADAEEEGGAGD